MKNPFWAFLLLFCTLLNAEERFLLGGSYAPIVEQASKSVVYLMTDSDNKVGVASPFIDDGWFEPYLRYPQLGLTSDKLRRSIGSGVIIRNDGLIVTSARFVENRSALKVMVDGYSELFDAKVLGSDTQADIAVLKIISENLHTLNYSDSLKSGDLLFAIGNPFGLEPVVSMGVVSNLGSHKQYDKFIASDLAIHGGNVGGAVIDASGNLAGIAVRLKGMSSRENQGGFFLPMDRVRTIAERIERSGSAKEAWIGIAVADLTQEMRSYFGRDEGVIITAVEKNTPAEEAGLKRGDLIILADDIVVNSVFSFDKIMATLQPDRDSEFLVLREKRIRSATVRIGRLEGEGVKSSKTIYHHGMVLETLNSSDQERLGLDKFYRGVVVISVDANSMAAKKGFEAGDLIFGLDDSEVDSIVTFQELIGKNPNARYLVNRGNITIKLDLREDHARMSSRE